MPHAITHIYLLSQKKKKKKRDCVKSLLYYALIIFGMDLETPQSANLFIKFTSIIKPFQ